MSSTKRESAELAALLLRKAKEDAAALRELAPNSEIADSIVGFHAQQAVEKWLKAVVASRGKTFEHTHDLRHLIATKRASRAPARRRDKSAERSLYPRTKPPGAIPITLHSSPRGGR